MLMSGVGVGVGVGVVVAGGDVDDVGGVGGGVVIIASLYSEDFNMCVC